VFRSQIARVKQIAGRRPVWAGIGAYHLSASETIENIRAARRLGAQGIILFSYDNLVAGANGDAEYLPTVGRESFK
jgi:dihydrodipicolinate synthase/N-acetylneuraminate lyase